MFETFAKSTRVAFDDAKYEAARRGDRRVGTDHLLISLLNEPAIATAVGADAEAARRAAEALDRGALKAVGVDLGDYRAPGRASLGRHVPLTAGAKSVLQRTLAIAASEKSRSLTPRHMMLALLERPAPDPAADLLAALGTDPDRTRERLAAV
ncbi:Clp protease N-terminal domain-containing protein [Gryllotalpicola ginsengisoli]|uniref:Clp protease N-terminal domain-containing protein n=1 Tax=Gryllotalpicola ginsengisoli TaxID=444608 RepID=UPI0003B5318C|nr:Clp protease N-terminal domain-containing protein [Gryllotalpicola ginsengisoli]